MERKKAVNNYIGQRFGKLVVLSEVEPVFDSRGYRRRRFNCQCDCGNTVVVKATYLQRGVTNSCGCLRSESKKRINLVGQKFGMLTVLSEAAPRPRRKENGCRRMWYCRCDCGKTKTIMQVNLTSQDGTRSCGCLFWKVRKSIRNGLDLTGNQYGWLTVLRRADVQQLGKNNNRTYWECLCDCGTNTIVQTDHLVNGHTRSCGCMKRYMKRGKRFGKLTLISAAMPKQSMRYWNCRCDCGRKLTVSIDTIFRANSVCCECRDSAKPRLDLTGRAFGRLTVLMELDPIIDRRGNHIPCWLCRCSCGREVVVRQENLLRKVTRSCGCLRRKAKE